MRGTSWDREPRKKLTSRQKSMARQQARETGRYVDPMKVTRRKKGRDEDGE